MTDVELFSSEVFPLLSILVRSTSTVDLEVARGWVLELFGEFNPAPFFFSPVRFERCERTGDSLSLTLSGEHCYGLGFGPVPPVNPTWTRCSIDKSTYGDECGALVATERWDFYSIDTAQCENEGQLAIVDDSDVIRQILTTNAPQSKVWPGNPEIVDWYGVRDAHGEWASIAALVRWESGRHVLSSVVTVAQVRGQGFARRLVRGIGGEMQRQGFRWLGLGVTHDNTSAQRTYEGAGFQRCADFTAYGVPATE